MPRRIYTYADESWEGYNLASTIGSYVMGVAILLFAVNVLKTRRSGRARRQRPVAGGHARVVHDLAAAAAQLRRGAVRDERADRSTTCEGGCVSSVASASLPSDARVDAGRALPAVRRRERRRRRPRRRERGARARRDALGRSRSSRCRCSSRTSSSRGSRIRRSCGARSPRSRFPRRDRARRCRRVERRRDLGSRAARRRCRGRARRSRSSSSPERCAERLRRSRPRATT